MRFASCFLLLASAPLGTLGCALEYFSPTEVEDLGEFEQRICIDPGVLDLRPNGVELVALRRRVQPEVFRSSWGEACAGAADESARARCLDDLEAVAVDVSPLVTRNGLDYDVVVSEQGMARIITSRRDLIAVLAPIDTPSEAALVALSHGEWLFCAEDNVRAEGRSFVLLVAEHGECGTPTWKGTVRVGSDGSFARDEGISLGGDECLP